MKKTAAAVFCIILCLTLLPLVPAYSAGSTKVSNLVLTLDKAKLSPFSSASSLSELSFAAGTSGVKSLTTQWYENGVSVENVYGASAWKTKKLKANSTYYAMVIVSAKDGYSFTSSTKVSVNGSDMPCTVIYVSDDGSYIGVLTGELRTACEHVWGSYIYSEIGHWKLCSICGESSEITHHEWSKKSEASGKINYACSACGATKTESSDQTKINVLYFDLGYPFVGDLPTATYLPMDKKVQAGFTLWAWGTTPEDQPTLCESGFRYEAGKYYRINAAFAANEGYRFEEGTTQVNFVINGIILPGKLVSLTAETCVWCALVAPVEAPTYKIVLPDEIKAGDDLIRLATQCRVYYNGSLCGNSKVVLSVDGTDFPNVCEGGVWLSGSDTESMINKVYSGLGESMKKNIRSLYTAQAGRSYTFCISYFSDDFVEVKNTKTEKFTIEGASSATCTRLSDNLVTSATYYVAASKPTVLALSDAVPAVGQKPENVTSGNFRKTWNVSEPLVCGKDYTVTYVKYADKAGDFLAAPLVTFNGSPVEYTLLTSEEAIRFNVRYNLEHTRVTETVDPTCAAAGLKTEKCSECGKLFSEEILEVLPHKLTHVEGETGTCMSASRAEHYVCSDCGGIFADKDGKIAFHGSVTGLINPANHVGGGQYYNGTEHWVRCQCGEIINKGAHSFTADGKVCTLCGYNRDADITRAEVITEFTPRESTAPEETTTPATADVTTETEITGAESTGAVTTSADTAAESTAAETTAEETTGVDISVPDDTSASSPESGADTSATTSSETSEMTGVQSSDPAGSSEERTGAPDTSSPENTIGGNGDDGADEKPGIGLWIAIGLAGAGIIVAAIVILRKKSV